MTYWGKVTNDIEKAMSDGSVFTATELAQHLGSERNAVSKSLSRMRRINKTKQVYIVRWEHGGYLRAVYGWGDKPDARRPRALPNTLVQRQVRARKKKKVSSVWQIR